MRVWMNKMEALILQQPEILVCVSHTRSPLEVCLILVQTGSHSILSGPTCIKIHRNFDNYSVCNY
jgi:hypothetical protein